MSSTQPLHPSDSSGSDPRNLEHLLMEFGHHAQNAALATPPHVHADVVGNPQFANFSFSYDAAASSHSGRTADLTVDTSDPYGINAFSTGSASAHRHSITTLHHDHRNSVASLPEDPQDSITPMTAVPRASFSNGPLGRTGNASISDGSEDASPASNRAGGLLDGAYNDGSGLGSGAIDGSDLGGRAKEDKNDPNPPWSELKTKAGKERKRLPLACIACRRKKIRCSGEKPACKHCVRSRIPCVYKVTTRKAAPRTDYMAMLDKRLKRMEERIIKIVPKEEQDVTVISVTRAVVKPGIPGSTTVKNANGKKRSADDAFAQELDHWSKTVSTSNIDGGGTKPMPLMIQEAEENRLSTEGAEALPSVELQEHLSEIFFENVNGQTYHLLHKPSFMRKLRAGTVPPVLILAVCAISARFSTHPKLSTFPAFLRGEEWAAPARSIVVRRYEWPNITILTCLLILGLHEFGTCQGGRSWSLGGQAIRMAYALQLHLDLDYDPHKLNGTAQLSFIDREIRRRTMWSCFLMDRFNSSGTDRPIFIKESSIKVQLPIKEKYFQLDMPGPTKNLQGEVLHPINAGEGQLSDPDENMGVAAYMIRSIALWGHIVNYINLGGKDQDKNPMWHPDSMYTRLVKQTEDFESSLPTHLQYTPENLHTHETEALANQFLFLHVSVQQNVLFMNRFAVPVQPGGRPPPDVPKDFVAQAGVKAFRAANKITALLSDGESHFITAPFTGYCAFLSSTVHVFGSFSNNPAMEAASKKSLAINIRYLTKMKKFWGMFHWMAENLKQQYRACADAQNQGASANASSKSSSIFQYGDWFDRYPHGVSKSDFEDPLSGVKKEKGDDAVLGEKSGLHTVEQFFDTLEAPQTTHDRDHGKNMRLKTRKRQSSRPEELTLTPVDTDLSHMRHGNVSTHQNVHQVTPGYNQMTPSTPLNMYHPQQTYYNHEVMLPPHQQGILPQLDRQLVFGAYANMDTTTQNMLDGQGWQMGGGMSSFTTEPTSAWFMPFNMEPPDMGHEQQDGFHSMGGTYGIGGMIDNNGNMEGHTNG
ncbi:related to nitrate assimilation regulatory protein nirA [Rhynchosporium secalis]|uniref:Related to nitrate assimilation regulatory protein nirA n=1 Tax=Rhynchosporium secalis TaxID=38038 RepID=A0A1E1MJH4_RHYSE|nr:related to nitrate assimilation regulatory protein nirA [Rhynchosporium secalis]